MFENKTEYTFHELSPLTGIKPYVIRFWEVEFGIDGLIKNGEKFYLKQDVDKLLQIKKLLFEDKLSILEAKARLDLPEANIITPVRNEFVPRDSKMKTRNVLNLLLQEIEEIKLKNKW